MLQVEGCAHGGNVIVQALGDLIRAEQRMALGHDDLLDELTVLAGGHAVVDEVIFQARVRRTFALAQHDLRAQGDQQWRRVADG